MSVEDQQKRYEELAEKFVLLDVPMIVDRSADEEKDDAKAEWRKVYEAIFAQTDSTDSSAKNQVDSFLDTEVENEKENDASGMHSFEYSAAWDGGTDRMRADEKEYNRYKKNRKQQYERKCQRKKRSGD